MSTRNTFPYSVLFRTGGIPTEASARPSLPPTILETKWARLVIVGLWSASTLILSASKDDEVPFEWLMLPTLLAHVSIEAVLIFTIRWDEVGSQSRVRVTHGGKRLTPEPPMSRGLCLLILVLVEGLVMLAATVPEEQNVYKCILGTEITVILVLVASCLLEATRDSRSFFQKTSEVVPSEACCPVRTEGLEGGSPTRGESYAKKLTRRPCVDL